MSSVTVAISEYPAVTIPDRATASLASFREWAGNNNLPDQVKLCFYRREVVLDMGKEQIFTHIFVKTAITSVLFQLVEQDQVGLLLSDGVLVTNKEADLSCNPDAVFVAHDSRTKGRVKLVRGKDGGFVELLGTPDMVLEVVSDSSEKKDNQTLFEGYFEAGIPEYWLVDARGAEIEFSLYKRSGKKYTATRAQDGWVKSSVFEKSFRLVRGSNPLGDPTVRLEVK